jgi:heterodisulfide reductase subunit C
MDDRIKKIKLTDRGVEFLRQVEEISGEAITVCEQCGTCSGGCPFVEEMDITPSQIMRKVMLGQEEVLHSRTMWICASCFTCTVRCPRKLDVSKVAEALRQIRLREAIDAIDISKLPKEEVDRMPTIALVSACRKLTG